MTDRAPVARATMTPEEIAAWERDPGGWVRRGALTCSQGDCNGKVAGVGQTAPADQVDWRIERPRAADAE